MKKYSHLPVSRKEAISKGETIYYTGKPCKHGHVATRYTHSGCSECRNVICATSYRSKPEHKKKALVESRKWYNKNTKKAKLQSKQWRETNRDKVNASSALRRAKKLKAIPSWTTQHEIDRVTKYLYKQVKTYSEKSRTKERYTVDHIIPLNSKVVCGLHCEENLRIITEKENQTKKNKLLTNVLLSFYPTLWTE